MILAPTALDDNELVTKFMKLRKDVRNKKAMFELNSLSPNGHDYLKVTLARLAYEFAKEEYTEISSEVHARGLIAK